MEEQEFFEQLKKSNLPVVVDFWAPWCSPCKAVEPHLKKLEQEYTGRVDVWRVNSDDSKALKSSLHILGIPTLIIYRQGKEVTRCTGVVSITILSWLFETALSGVAPTQTIYALRERFIQVTMGISRFLTRLEKHLAPKTNQ